MSSELRTRLITQMDLHGLAPNTQRGYVMCVKALAAYYKESPERLTDEQIRAYFHHLLKERKLTRRSCRRYLTGLTFFYRHVCQREVNDRFGLPAWRGEKKLPIVLSIEEVTRLLSCEHNLKHRVLLKTIYSAGLRVSEAVRLKPHHIESDPSRMLIRVEDGKGKKDRYTVLSKNLLKELRLYWKKYRPGKWLFPGYGHDKHLSTIAASQVFYNAKKKAGITKACGIHSLRHSFATHSLYRGTDLYTISKLLGHSSVKTTTIYLHIIPERFVELKSPLDHLDLG